MGRKDFKISNPQKDLDKLNGQFSKYNLGEIGLNFHEIKNHKPIFAFDYLSLNGEKLCFNSTSLVTKDYVGLLNGLKKISEKTYQELHDTKIYRFHKIDFDSKSVTISKLDFKKALTNKPDLLKDEELPNLWQFDLHFVQEARVAGFLFKGIFYLIWYDRNHSIYDSN